MKDGGWKVRFSHFGASASIAIGGFYSICSNERFFRDILFASSRSAKLNSMTLGAYLSTSQFQHPAAPRA